MNHIKVIFHTIIDFIKKVLTLVFTNKVVRNTALYVVIISILLSGILYSIHFVYSAYKVANIISPLEEAMRDLGFDNNKNIEYKENGVIKSRAMTSEQQIEALLTILHINGRFKADNVWQDLNKLQYVEDRETIFKKMMIDLEASGATQPFVEKFDPKILRKRLFKNTNFSKYDAADWILLLSQHLYRRSLGVERNEIQKLHNIEDSEDLILHNARILGLVNRISPSSYEYDAAWIAGGSRATTIARIIDFMRIYHTKQIRILTEITMLAGDRPLWPEIDGIAPEVMVALNRAQEDGLNIDDLAISLQQTNGFQSIREGKEYMLSLAKRLDVKLNPEMPFVFYIDFRECPPGLMPYRNYPYYLPNEPKIITEFSMSIDMLKNYSNIMDKKIHILNATPNAGGVRSNTQTTALDAGREFIDKIKSGLYIAKKDFRILFQTNNPFIDRQAITAQIEVNKLLEQEGLDQTYTITIEGVGYSNKSDTQVVASEIAALIATKYRAANIKTSRPMDSLMYQTGEIYHYIYDIPEMPNISIKDRPKETFFDSWVTYFDNERK